MGTVAQAFGPSPAAFASMLGKSWMGSGTAWTSTGVHVGCRCYRQRPNYATGPVPGEEIFKAAPTYSYIYLSYVDGDVYTICEVSLVIFSII